MVLLGLQSTVYFLVAFTVQQQLIFKSEENSSAALFKISQPTAKTIPPFCSEQSDVNTKVILRIITSRLNIRVGNNVLSLPVLVLSRPVSLINIIMLQQCPTLY